MAEGEIAQPPPTNADGGNDANNSKKELVWAVAIAIIICDMILGLYVD